MTLSKEGDVYAGMYGAGQFDMHVAYPYIAFVVNCSQCWALYCLVLFYLGTHEELEARNVEPLGKFMAIKLIIFFTWWQSFSIALAVHFGFIRAEHFVTCTDDNAVDCWTIDEIGESLNDVIICCEMLGFAIGTCRPALSRSASRAPCAVPSTKAWADQHVFRTPFCGFLPSHPCCASALTAHIWVFPVPRAVAYDALRREGLDTQGCELK